MELEEIVKSLSTSKLSSYLLDCFEGDALEDLAKKTRFIERCTSKLSGKMFLSLNLADFGDTGGMSLTEKCEYLYDTYGLEMKKQSLDGRYNTFAVKFMRVCFEEAFRCFSSDFSGIEGVSSLFNGIFITDATSFQLPASLAHFYTSNGGSTSGASLKIHQTFELLKGQVCEFDLTDGKDNDATYWKRSKLNVVPNALYIADLGYYKLDYFSQVAAEGGYWLSRYKTGTTLYTKNTEGEMEVLNFMEVLTNEQVSLQVYLGKEQKLPVRLLGVPVPARVKEERLKKVKAREKNQSKQKRSYSTSSLKKFLCGFNLFVTNVPAQKLSIQQVVNFYALRWQIELLFKIWKSLLVIDKIGPMSIFRFECYLYGKLILLLLTTQVKAFLEQASASRELELSEWKTVKYLKKSSHLVSIFG